MRRSIPDVLARWRRGSARNDPRAGTNFGMGVILEIRAGVGAGKVIPLKTGESVTIGRAAGRAQFALPHDTFMSGVHFAVECGPSGCRVQDRKSSNGTFLNGARITEAMLANGDEIKGGQTIFAVKIVADAKLASMLPPEEVAPPSQEIAPPAATPQRPRAAEPPPPRAEMSSPPSSPPAVRPAEGPNAAPVRNIGQSSPGRDVSESAAGNVAREPAVGEAAYEPPLSARPSAADAAPPAMRTADLDQQAAQSRPAAAESHVPTPGSLRPGAEQAAKNIQPPVEEPPSFRAVPSPPSVSAKPPRGGEPPPGVAPHIAQKFGDRPASRSAMSPRGAAFSVMGWSFPAAPAEWQVQEGFGLQQSGHEEFPSSLAATEESLGGITLQQYVESQISTLRGYLRDPKIEPTMPPLVGGADESMAMDVRHLTKDGRELVYRRIYARSGASVGVLTVTTLAADLPQVLQSLQPLLDGAAFRSTLNN
ncbi:MAG: FHA domain-containing protein [Candidatus Acidiferrum sp.]